MAEAPTTFGDISATLIDENYRQMGCDAWSRDRFYRLCAKLQRTQREMAALLRINPDHLRKRLIRGFTKQDGVLLTIMEQEIEYLLSGKQPTRGIFLITNLQKAAS